MANEKRMEQERLKRLGLTIGILISLSFIVVTIYGTFFTGKSLPNKPSLSSNLRSFYPNLGYYGNSLLPKKTLETLTGYPIAWDDYRDYISFKKCREFNYEYWLANSFDERGSREGMDAFQNHMDRMQKHITNALSVATGYLREEISPVEMGEEMITSDTPLGPLVELYEAIEWHNTMMKINAEFRSIENEAIKALQETREKEYENAISEESKSLEKLNISPLIMCGAYTYYKYLAEFGDASTRRLAELYLKYLREGYERDWMKYWDKDESCMTATRYAVFWPRKNINGVEVGGGMAFVNVTKGAVWFSPKAHRYEDFDACGEAGDAMGTLWISGSEVKSDIVDRARDSVRSSAALAQLDPFDKEYVSVQYLNPPDYDAGRTGADGYLLVFTEVVKKDVSSKPPKIPPEARLTKLKIHKDTYMKLQKIKKIASSKKASLTNLMEKADAQFKRFYLSSIGKPVLFEKKFKEMSRRILYVKDLLKSANSFHENALFEENEKMYYVDTVAKIEALERLSNRFSTDEFRKHISSQINSFRDGINEIEDWNSSLPSPIKSFTLDLVKCKKWVSSWV